MIPQRTLCRLWCALAFAGLNFVPAPASAQSDSSQQSVETLLDNAQQLERDGQWEKAFHLYCRLTSIDRQLPGLREHLHICLRHALQVRRHRDATFHEKVLSLPFPKALDLYAEVVAKLQGQYVDRGRSLPSRLLQVGFDELLAALDDPTFQRQYLRRIDSESVRDFAEKLRHQWADRSVRDARDARTIVREVALAAQRDLRVENAVVIVMEFMAGACNALDEYTAYLTPGQLIAESSRPLMELYAYGLNLGIRGDRLLITEVRADSLAEAGTIRKDDTVVRINKTAIHKATPDTVAELLRQPVAVIELELAPTANGPHYTIRIPSQLPTVVGSAILKDGVGYLHLVGFRETTLQELDETILSLRGRGMKSLVLDLRGNPGGLFLTGVQAAERFVGGGILVTTQGQLEEFNKTYQSVAGMNAHSFPLVLLVDADTASAAEVFAAALKDNNRAVLIGTVTHGKGTIQVMRPIDAGGAIRITVGRFFSPSGYALSQVGITPHLVEADRARQLELALDYAARQMLPPGMRMEMRP